ncbi:unnamed protein product [Ambrosiozyma monospora]|uniref:Unnamed protein product n=1 Tax=Ambrosiozyma monospora TaxID=43982 RepID=A0ACB5TY05_AMBMO|nr:unnamed protein product [Ambrosiozyma monospora]
MVENTFNDVSSTTPIYEGTVEQRTEESQKPIASVDEETPLSDSYNDHNQDYNNNHNRNNDDQNDLPTTTKSDVIGWCLYSWAAEPFVVSVVGTYIPLLLEQIARDNGVKLSDKISPNGQGISNDQKRRC